MAGSLNKCMFIGNLGKDPEVRVMQNGKKVANLSLAVTETWKQDGEKKERTEWVRVVIFGALADIAENYTQKGSKVYVCGSMQTRKWADQSGTEKYSTEVVLQGFGAELILLDGKAKSDDRPVADNAKATRGGHMADLDDDVPFSPEFR